MRCLWNGWRQACRDGEREKFSRAPRRLGAQPPLKITDKVTKVFQVASFWHQISMKSIFRPGSVPDPGGNLTTLPRPIVGWCGDTHPKFSSLPRKVFQVASFWHQISMKSIFRPGSVSDRGGKLTTLPRPIVGWCGDTHPKFPSFDSVTIKGSLLMSLPIIKRFWRNVHAPCHVTQGRGSQITTYLESPTLYCLFTL